MNVCPYVLSFAAESDLRSIIRYSIRMWGEQQSRAYVQKLEAAACEVAQGRGSFKLMDELLPGLRARRSGKHFLFCMPRQRRKP